jgi:hypothetical protein
MRVIMPEQSDQIGERAWISACEAGRILDCPHQRIATIAAAAGIRRRVLPGLSRLQYRTEDVRRVASESVLS